MIVGLIVLVACQLVGEFVVRLAGLPVPGPVAGMVALLIVLLIRRPDPRSGIVRTADALQRHLPLLFVPAGVGVIGYLPTLAASWLPAVGRLVVPWLLALVATALAGVGTVRLQEKLRTSRAKGIV